MRARALLAQLLAFAALAAAVDGSSPAAEVREADVALAADDECEGVNSGSCSLNALQMQGHRRMEPPQSHGQSSPEAVSSTSAGPSNAVSVPSETPEATPALEGKVSRPRMIRELNKTSPRGPCAEEYGCGLYDKARRCQCNVNCTHYGNCCSDYQSTCAIHATSGTDSTGQVVLGYHQTSPEIGKLILGSAFRPGTRGYCGGAIYFAQTPQATFTKAVGPDSKQGFIIEATIDMGRSTYIPYPTCFSPWYCLLVPGTLSSQPVSSYLTQYHLDSVTFNPGDGVEYVIGDPARILSMKQWGT